MRAVSSFNALATYCIRPHRPLDQNSVAHPAQASEGAWGKPEIFPHGPEKAAAVVKRDAETLACQACDGIFCWKAVYGHNTFSQQGNTLTLPTQVEGYN